MKLQNNQKKNKCVILNHHKDIDKFNNKSVDIFSKNFFPHYYNKKIVQYLGNKKIPKNTYNFLYSYKNSWFRYKNVDFSLYDNVLSIGNVFSNYFIRDLSIILRNYYYLNILSKKYDIIYISQKDSKIVKEISKLLFNKIKIYNSEYNYESDLQIDQVTKFNSKINNVNSLSIGLRTLQYFVKKKIKLRTMIFPDPSYNHLFEKPIYLKLNKFNIFNSYCYNFFVKLKKKRFRLNKKYFLSNLEKYKNNNNISFENKINIYIYNYISQKIKNNLNIVLKYYYLNKEIFENYQPKQILVPGTDEWNNLILTYAAVSKKIKVNTAVDGSYITFFKDIIYDKSLSKILHDKVFLYSKIELNKFKKLQYSKNKFSVVNLPVAQKFLLKKSTNKYDLIILDYKYNFNPYSLESKKDMSIKTILEILDEVSKMKIKKIAIKMKPSNEKKNNEYIKILQNEIMNKNYKMHIDYLYEDFSETLNKSNLFLGGISTAILETLCAKKKYIIYSPSYIGFTELDIKLSPYLKKNNLIRNKVLLKNFIYKKNGTIRIDTKQFTHKLDLNEKIK
jgi:hypothetical protein